MRAHKLYGVHKVAQALQRIIFALYGRKQRIGRGKRVYGKQSQRRRAVYEYIIIIFAHLVQRALQYRFAGKRVYKLHLRTRKLLAGAYQIKPFGGGLYGGLGRAHAVYHNVVYAVLRRFLINAKAAGAVALRVNIYAQHPFAQRRNACGKVDCGGGLPHPALLVCNGYYLGHAFLISLSFASSASMCRSISISS